MTQQPFPPPPWAAPGQWAPPVAPQPVPRGPWVRISLLQVVVVVVVFGAVGAGCGLLWWHLWPQPSGTVVQGQWYTSETGLRSAFDATAIYAVTGIVAGGLLGILSGFLLSRSEILTLLAVAGGACLAAWLMTRVGVAQGPPDPTVLARTAADQTVLKGNLQVSGAVIHPHLWRLRLAFSSVYLVWPGFALGGLTFVYLVFPRRLRPVRAGG